MKARFDFVRKRGEERGREEKRMVEKRREVVM